ncbi:MAG: hypothetical protein PHN16_03005 [Candidatus Omnitrophica bacterium]|jgi:hypothetical protein|nr:hypothetical protein [Candidatus Omnitrophota bacterium]
MARGGLSPAGAIKIFERFVSLKLGEGASYFVAAESRKFLHLHSLVGNVGGFNRFVFMKAWEERYGFARCFPYDNTLGAAYYLAKEINSDRFEWDIYMSKRREDEGV